jgi:ribosome-associated protein
LASRIYTRGGVPDEERPPPPRYERKKARQAEGEQGRDLVARLVAQPARVLDRLDLGEELREALAEAQRLEGNQAVARQLRYVGKLAREAGLAGIEARLGRLLDPPRATEQRRIAWRDRLVTEGDAAIEAFAVDHPEVDRQRLRSLVRRAMTAPEAQRGGAARGVLELLKELDQARERETVHDDSAPEEA